MGTPPSPLPQNGNIDVKPSDLHRVSGGFAVQQPMYSQAAKTLVTKLQEHPDAGGYGTAAQAFATAYVEAGNKFLDVWAKSVVSIGGAAVGFASTANNYSKAEAANDPTGQKKPVVQAPPQVIDKAPDYGQVPNLKWGDDDGGDGWLRSILEWIPEVVRDAFRPVLKHAFRWGKVADVYPFPQQHYLNDLSKAWRDLTITLSMTESALTGQVSSITQQSNSEWHDAMRKFCSSLWGTSAWGKSTAGYEWKHDSASATTGATHPVMTVLFDTAMKISDLLYDFAEAAVDLNGKVWDIYMRAVREALGKIDLSDGVDGEDVKEGAKAVGRFLKGLAKGAAELSLEITLNIDKAALNAVVEAYNTRVNGLVPKLKALMEPLNEAHRAAPTFRAEDARAQAFGARALNEFKQQPLYTVPGEDKDNHFYPVDLANQEGVHNSHVIDKHVGQSDEQLLNRLRDQPTITAASTFPDLAIAQKATQDAMDEIGPDGSKPENAGKPNLDVNNPKKIERWLSVPRQDNSILALDPVEFDYATGRTVPAGSTTASDTHSVKVVLKYKNGIDPPYVVYTSMPSNP